MRHCVSEHATGQSRINRQIDARPFVSYRFPLNNDGDPTQIAVLNDFRAVIIAILQARDLSLGARLMVLGFLLEDAEKVFSSSNFVDACELLPVLESFVAMLSHPALVYIGGVSYPLYLWHWPLLAFYRYGHGAPGTEAGLVIAFVAK